MCSDSHDTYKRTSTTSQNPQTCWCFLNNLLMFAFCLSLPFFCSNTPSMIVEHLSLLEVNQIQTHWINQPNRYSFYSLSMSSLTHIGYVEIQATPTKLLKWISTLQINFFAWILWLDIVLTDLNGNLTPNHCSSSKSSFLLYLN